MSQEPPVIPASGPTLADFTAVELILPRLESRNMEGAIQELSAAFPAADSRWDASKLEKAALAREQQMSTAMDFGVAFPHVRGSFCHQLRFALGRAEKPLAWGTDGGPGVQFVFLNAVPTTEAMGYLKLVSGMARLGKDTALLAEFRAATDAPGLFELLRKIALRR